MFGKKKKVLVKTFTSRYEWWAKKQMESEANRLARQGYVITNVSWQHVDHVIRHKHYHSATVTFTLQSPEA